MSEWWRIFSLWFFFPSLSLFLFCVPLALFYCALSSTTPTTLYPLLSSSILFFSPPPCQLLLEWQQLPPILLLLLNLSIPRVSNLSDPCKKLNSRQRFSIEEPLDWSLGSLILIKLMNMTNNTLQVPYMRCIIIIFFNIYNIHI